jgi:hypothetical protein
VLELGILYFSFSQFIAFFNLLHYESKFNTLHFLYGLLSKFSKFLHAGTRTYDVYKPGMHKIIKPRNARLLLRQGVLCIMFSLIAFFFSVSKPLEFVVFSYVSLLFL